MATTACRVLRTIWYAGQHFPPDTIVHLSANEAVRAMSAGMVAPATADDLVPARLRPIRRDPHR